jgi:hypothetical protein
VRFLQAAPSCFDARPLNKAHFRLLLCLDYREPNEGAFYSSKADADVYILIQSGIERDVSFGVAHARKHEAQRFRFRIEPVFRSHPDLSA